MVLGCFRVAPRRWWFERPRSGELTMQLASAGSAPRPKPSQAVSTACCRPRPDAGKELANVRCNGYRYTYRFGH